MTTTIEKPKYIQLADRLRERIHRGDLQVGDRLPSYAEMYREFGATTATVQRVCVLLEQEQLIERRSGSGIYVAESAQSSQKRTGNIGLLIHSFHWESTGDIPYISPQIMLAGIRQACAEHQMEILLIDDNEAVHPEKTDGIIILCDKLEAYAMGISEDTPLVFIGQQADGIASIKIDDFNAGKLVTSHLIKNGHQRIACLMEGVFDETLQRVGGYKAALQKVGVDADAHWLKQTKKVNLSPTFSYLHWGRENMRAWLDDDWHQLNCTAIVVQNDYAAIGVMQTLQEAGIDVPGQVSVIGFDGTGVCDLVRPRLTSVQVPFYQMGYEAVKVLCQQMEHSTQNRVPATITLPVHLREGHSVLKI